MTPEASGEHPYGRGARFGSVPVLVLVYVDAIAAAESIAAAEGAVAGAICHAVVLLALLNSYVFASRLPESRIFPLLALAPLLRLLSLTVPTRHVAELWWYPMVGAPFLLAVFLASRVCPLSWSSLRLRRQDVLRQAAVAAAGAPLSVAAYAILKPEPLISPLSPSRLVVGSLILAAFSAFPEEVVFRGLLQDAACDLFGGRGVVIVSVLFASLYIGSLSAPYVAFVGVVGLAFAVVVERTGVLWGVVGAHTVLNVGLLLVWPTVYG